MIQDIHRTEEVEVVMVIEVVLDSVEGLRVVDP